MSENKEPGDLDEYDDADVSSVPTPTSTTTSGARGRSRRGPGRPTHPHMHQTGTDLEPKDAAFGTGLVCVAGIMRNWVKDRVVHVTRTEGGIHINQLFSRGILMWG